MMRPESSKEGGIGLWGGASLYMTGHGRAACPSPVLFA
ncbi:hypothetical protein SXCC_03272 [Gluconacetobacter sp. SXCC-1]|nr:hypothetical protein SXCC_03272 [Gluconacetobacter sp. SXCC-1]